MPKEKFKILTLNIDLLHNWYLLMPNEKLVSFPIPLEHHMCLQMPKDKSHIQGQLQGKCIIFWDRFLYYMPN